MEFYPLFLHLLGSRYPATQTALGGAEGVKERLSINLLCPHAIALPRALKTEAEAIVDAFFALRNLPEWKSRQSALSPVAVDRGHSSALMSYDFHVDEAGHLRLIEINTNASMSLLADLQYELHGIPNEFARAESGGFRSEIVATFLDEYRKAGFNGEAPRGVAITDEVPEKQRLYIEFLMFQELFECEGWKTTLIDSRELRTDSAHRLMAGGDPVNLVYNRHTDFYLQSADTAALREANANRTACVTPNPFEYRLLADKERLLELSLPGAIAALPLEPNQRAALERCLIRTLDVQKVADPDALWNERKKWFFKPMRSFGSKAAYRGSSVRRGAWSQILEGEYVAQEYVPAPSITVGAENTEFKFDLRFYAYEGRIQLAAARLYQGQTTNSQTPGGGLTVIRWT